MLIQLERNVQEFEVLFQGNKIPEMGKSLQKAHIIHIRSEIYGVEMQFYTYNSGSK